jgi:hypothetical protein
MHCVLSAHSSTPLQAAHHPAPAGTQRSSTPQQYDANVRASCRMGKLHPTPGSASTGKSPSTCTYKHGKQVPVNCCTHALRSFSTQLHPTPGSASTGRSPSTCRQPAQQHASNAMHILRAACCTWQAPPHSRQRTNQPPSTCTCSTTRHQAAGV